MNRDIVSCSNVTNRDVFIFVRNAPYCGWVFYHTSSCTMLCYRRRYVYEYEAYMTNTLAATYVYEYAAV